MSRLNLFDNRPAAQKPNRLPSKPEEEVSEDRAVGLGRFPSWLHRKMPRGGNLWSTGKNLESKRLHTVCEEARCPNLPECWSKKTATYLVLGRACTRACGFCDIDHAKVLPAPEADEPLRVAQSVQELGLKHAVITMVARDDLPDGGAAHLVAIVQEIRRLSPSTTLELLTSDFQGDMDALHLVLDASPEVFNHNVETVERLSPRVRHKATYKRSLQLLTQAKQHLPHRKIKSGIMVGLGEAEEEVAATLKDLHSAGVDIVTIGQYLQPNRDKLLVRQFITPEQFQRYEEIGKSLGIPHMYCGPFVRSSYNADLFAH